MINETRKILADDTIGVSATTVRVPVFFAHSESINLETHEKLTADQARECLAPAPGVKIMDDPENQQYPLAVDVAGTDEVYVGRIRDDASIENGLNLWVVADNLRKGAALKRYPNRRKSTVGLSEGYGTRPCHTVGLPTSTTC